MNSIVISGKVSSDVSYQYDQSNKVSDAYFMMQLFFDSKDKEGKTTTTTVEVPVHCRGYAAQNIDISESGWVILTGTATFSQTDDKKQQLHLSGEVQSAAVNSRVNTVNLIGRLGGDPETQYFDSGRNLARFSVAVNRTKEIPDWFRVEAWAQKAVEYLGKGSQAGITGQLKYETWTDKNTGELSHAWKVNCTRVSLIGGKREQSQSNNYGGYEDDF